MELLAQYTDDNSKSIVIGSKIPEITREEDCFLGIDEAGRGPVLGPMVYGAFFCPITGEEKLKNLGFADSKTLTEEKRELLFETINKNEDSMGWFIEIHSPNILSNKMLRRSKYNLNAISHDSAIELINRTLTSGVKLKEVYVDTVGKPETYQQKLLQLFPDLKITVAKKADSTYPVVSAASICAKVARDECLKKWKFLEKDQFDEIAYGSGYPGDPETKSFLNKCMQPVFGFPQLVRFSWSTASKILESKAVEFTWDDPEDQMDTEKSPMASASLLSFFKKDNMNQKPKSHSFFKDRCLSQMSSF